LRRLGCVAQAEGHERELEEAKGGSYGGLLDVGRIDRTLL
jgi:hypothetical protein